MPSAVESTRLEAVSLEVAAIPLGTEHLCSLVIAVCRTSGIVDDRDGAVCHLQGDDRGIHISRFPNGRVTRTADCT